VATVVARFASSQTTLTARRRTSYRPASHAALAVDLARVERLSHGRRARGEGRTHRLHATSSPSHIAAAIALSGPVGRPRLADDDDRASTKVVALKFNFGTGVLKWPRT
jgi:hypothetical protein